ncbi:unnamed protein product [Sphenostylis stenocarpa]|uniref:Disease resistance R13L4/SHOC-2-like LRR domain-containing protein n=1 Tax=Sphenostylis stenocarpa TaxID=92480 RepID=A0AA86SYG2_9FABA|nr:unnamed protein product [Sphenostylis stenocarpa]
MANMKHLEVLQLGRWLHGSQKHHIEVRNEGFLKELKSQKNLKYLSLRGMSGISNLLNILQLERLETLDLKACHNLETLPNDISSLRNLRHLNLSDCYLLDKMPRGIEKLTELQELKGFVIGSHTKTACTISDLRNLEKLKQLSIHIASKAVVKEREFEGLKEMSALEYLKISWGTTETSYCDIEIILPPNLKKLHVKRIPENSIPEWLKPGKLPLVLNEL